MGSYMLADRCETAADLFLRTSSEYSKSPALLSGIDWMTFEDLGTAGARVIELLAEHGAGAGDRVVLYLRNSAILRIAEYGILAHGLVRVAVSSRLHPREIAAIAHDCEATIVCCDLDVEPTVVNALKEIDLDVQVLGFSDTMGEHTPAALLRRVPTPTFPISKRPDEDDPAMIIYSSGTTGQPKGAIVTQRAWIAHVRAAIGHMPVIGPGDVVLAVAPMSYFGGSIALDCSAMGAATVTASNFAATDVIRLLHEHRITLLPLAPIMLKEIVEHLLEKKLSPPKLRAIPYGGSAISADVLLSASRLFPGVLVQFYGLSEALAPISALSAKEHDEARAVLEAGKDSAETERARQILGSAGRPVAGIEIEIRGGGSTALSKGEQANGVGEVLIRGETVMRGYWNRPELTAAALDSSGWFHSGDVGTFDSEGFLHILDRQNDVIISGGFNVYPGEVERAIGSVSGLKEIAVVGAPHPRWGEAVHAFVVRDPDRLDGMDTTAGSLEEFQDEMLRACSERLAGYKKPVAFHFVMALPRNAAGKVDKRRLRDGLRH